MTKPERPEWRVLLVGIVQGGGRITCPRAECGLLDQHEARLHWQLGHFDRLPLDTTNLPPARRILGRGAGPRD